MAELNEGQQGAVYTLNKDLLVSASAGSGKTFSLCLRIVEKLCNKEHPASLDRFLIVTFTRAAAGEMRQRLLNMLQDRLEKEVDPELRRHIARQAALLPGARIGTIDSFCLYLVRSNFDRCGISSAVRVTDDTEMMPRKLRTMKKCIEKFYNEDSLAFRRLSDSLIAGYNDKDLPQKLVKLYEKISGCYEDIEILLKNSTAMRSEGEKQFAEGLYGKEIIGKLKERLLFYREEYRKYTEQLEACCPSSKGLQLIKEELSYINTGLTLAEDPAELCSFLSGYAKGTLRLPAEANDIPETAWFKLVRGEATALLLNRSKMNLDYDLSLYQESCLESAEIHEKLYQLFADYRKELWALKKRMGVLEFSDVERLTLGLLYEQTEKGREITDLAKELASDFDEVYIDEYQDVNELQDQIFNALSKRNRFAVGDVKQSIYGFRGACPGIFSEQRERYPDYREEGNAGKIFLKENYRSAPPVIRFVNACIAPLLSLCCDMRYMPEDDLVAKRQAEEGEKEILPAICLVPATRQNRYEAEAEYLAESVARLIASGIKAEDIGVLVRNMSRATEIRRAFDKAGLNMDISCKKGFFETPEILLLRCLLEVIDNPTKDIYLAGAMKSPVFGFTLEELTVIRKKGGGESLFSALIRYTEENKDDRCKQVLRFITRYRKALQECTAEKLVWRVMSEELLLPLLSFGKDEGEGRAVKENLLFFYELARSCSTGTLGELSRLLEKIEDLAKRDAAGDGKGGEPVPGHVRLMTVHGSKGLEFPVCWLYGFADTGGGGGSKLLYHPDFGCDMVLADRYGSGLKRKSALSACVKMKEEDRELDEELRILYVALTRARDRLYISATVGKTTAGEFETYSLCPQGNRTMLESTGKYINYLAMALGAHKELYRLYEEGAFPVEQPEAEAQLQTEEEPEERYGEEDLQPYLEKIGQRMTFRYPYAASVEKPEKLSVSVLSPSVLDDDRKDGEENEKQPEQFFGKTGLMPRFYSEKQRKEEDFRRFAKRGSATHAFMQFCDFAYLESEGMEREVQRLLHRQFLSPAVAELIEKESVQGFLESSLYQRMKTARKLFREQRFTIELPATDFTEEAEKKAQLAEQTILVQGVIDGFFVDHSGKLVLFDYKTDHFTKEQLKDPEKCKQILKSRHQRQLGYYRLAVEKMMGQPVDETYIYSFALSCGIELFEGEGSEG